MKKRPIVLCILDGYGLSSRVEGNAVKLANTPNIDDLMALYPTTTIHASGMPVGLPDGQMGNSEVGHLNIGAGRVVYQSLTLINKAIQEKTFFENEKFLKAIQHAKDNNSKLHIWGLLSNGGVHSSNEHIYGLLQLAKEQGLQKVYVHAFLDGRDVAPDSGIDFVKELQAKMEEIGVGEIASISGRYYAMDRDKRFERVALAYDAIVSHKGESFECPVQYVKDSYAKDTLDEFVIPGYNKNVDGTVDDNDAVIFANFRPDRAIQLATVLTNPSFYEAYTPEKQVKNIEFVCMMKYADSVNGEVAFVSPELTNTLGDYLAEKGLKQLRIAETEKYAHVTFFFDGGVDKEIEGATRVLVNSPKVATYDLQPEMSAYEVKDKLIAELDKDIHDVVIVNFANCDMVGHTGIIPAAINAVSVVDECVGEVYEKVLELGGTMLITADHGNAEEELDEEGNPYTAHTTNDVPLIVTNSHLELKDGGKLGDLAPTMLQLLGLPIPSEMDGESLIK
ncbi:2,3-bisphosphoglycerate-independent phosphoglycerate mutase [Coprobacillus sp. AF33-1AC]|uniref:2,3-bisphosphoglycerate-independent phosphoglycerate mutase n=1 Tax=Coprobacillus sp. AF33-1AC TaxID=2292032 RepID=UPI000E47A52B|nr:2,3-bisphosphoglycerate-independent phosphoglycerate mutase [Coprobacillus sp. AF33-1AC]RHM60873.1 2,3-bisphosphoglycerate-independent phosphoglycerate mutase [Coprobacillus sp. AF33-1AC]